MRRRRVRDAAGNSFSGLFSYRYTNDGLAGKNISDELLGLARHQVVIPHLGEVESLNVAAAAAPAAPPKAPPKPVVMLLTLGTTFSPLVGIVAALLALAGGAAWEYIWVEAGQSVPLS